MLKRRHSRKALIRRAVNSAIEVVIVMAVMLGVFELIGWLATMANAWVATL